MTERTIDMSKRSGDQTGHRDLVQLPEPGRPAVEAPESLVGVRAQDTLWSGCPRACWETSQAAGGSIGGRNAAVGD